MSTQVIELNIIDGPAGPTLGLQILDKMRDAMPRPTFPVNLYHELSESIVSLEPHRAHDIPLLVDGMLPESGKHTWYIVGTIVFDSKTPIWLTALLSRSHKSFTGIYNTKDREGVLEFKRFGV